MGKEIVIVTHSGSFHADDVFAVATLLLLIGDVPYVITRTRDMNVVATGDYVVDVGGVYDSEKKLFDHHQKGGAGARVNGIPYSSFGLVWKEYGEKLSGSKSTALLIETRIVSSIDASDNGIETYVKKDDVFPYTIQTIVDIFQSTWKEEVSVADERFKELVVFAKRVLEREIVSARSFEEGKKNVEDAYLKTEDKRIIVLDNRYSWEEVLMQYPEPLFVVIPDRQSGMWKVKVIRKDPLASFESRKDLPKDWAGKRGEELATITGVQDALFCHNKLFVAVAASKEGAIKLAELAVKSNE